MGEGKFAERGLKYNPETKEPFRADEFTLKYMEKTPEVWPMSSIQALAVKLAAVDHNKLGDSLGPVAFRAAIKEQLGIHLSDAEMVTMLRFCCVKGCAEISRERLQEVMANPPDPNNMMDPDE